MFTSGEIAQSGTVVTVIFAVIVAASSLSQIAPLVIDFTKASGAAEQLFKTIDRISEIDALSEEGLTPETCGGNVEVNDLHFSYPARPDAKVLKGLNLKIPANKTTALVGASGSGKSTIVGLLERWYDPAQGFLSLDGVDIREFNLQWLRTKVRLVQQVSPYQSYSLPDIDMRNLGTCIVQRNCRTERSIWPARNFATKYFR